MKIERVTIVAHEGKPRAIELEKDLVEWLTSRDIAVVDESPDLVVSLGGDGTVLRAASVAHEADALLLTVNLGTLGYLTEVDSGTEHQALERIASGDFTVEHRVMLECRVPGHEPYVGLNEVLVERTSRRRLVRLDVAINGEHLTTFNADGVIVATPTGSTAYALSAGGPIVSPRAECLVLVPVSPHMIFARPFVLSAGDVVTIEVAESPGVEDQQATLVLDGRIGREIGPGIAVEARRHERPLKLVRLTGPGFLERLRIKLDLPS